jgi:hypothetical protein
LRETTGSLFVYASMTSMLPQPDTHAFKEYRDRLLEDCGNPTDPIEVLIIEQIVLAHFNIGRLQFKAATAEGAEAAKVYGGLAAQLLGELRRTSLALQGYRLSARQLKLTAGVAPAIPAAVAADQGTAMPAATSRSEQPDIEVGRKEGDDLDDGTIVPFKAEEPEAGRGGEAQRPETERAVARGA